MLRRSVLLVALVGIAISLAPERLLAACLGAVAQRDRIAPARLVPATFQLAAVPANSVRVMLFVIASMSSTWPGTN